MRPILWLFATLTAALAAPALADPPPPLPAMHADPDKVSVSGLSSGAYMAGQYSVAYASSIMGAGMVAGGPYNCGANNPGTFAHACLKGTPSADSAWKSALTFAENDVTDPVEALKHQRIYIFGGRKDDVVKPPVVRALRDFYRKAKVPTANILSVTTMPAGHAFIAPAFGNACGTDDAPYIEHCAVAGKAYDQPYEILNHIYALKQPAAPTLSSAPVPFDQSAYAKPDALMAKQGWVYIPATCRDAGTRCAVHVVFHGCIQSTETVGDDVYADVGYNRWADGNGIILLYPQVDKTSVRNENGCWDWYGYTTGSLLMPLGLSSALRSAPQMRAIKAMVDRLLE